MRAARPSGATRFFTEAPLGRALRLGLIAAFLGAAMLLDIPLCPFAIITRHFCPGCGLTRATFALAHGHLGDALRFHPLSVVVSPLVIAALSFNAISYIRNGRWAATEAARGRVVTGISLALGAAMIAIWIARFFGAFGGPVPV